MGGPVGIVTVVVGGDELGEGNAALRRHLEQVDQLAAEQRHLRQQRRVQRLERLCWAVRRC